MGSELVHRRAGSQGGWDREGPPMWQQSPQACCWPGSAAPAVLTFLPFGSRLRFQEWEDLMSLAGVTGPPLGLCGVIAPIHRNEGMAKRVSMKYKNSDGRIGAYQK